MVVNLFFGGDYNISKGSNNHSCDILNGFCQGNSLSLLDRIPDGTNNTFHNDMLNRYTLIDYFVCSSDLVNSSVAGYTLNDDDTELLTYLLTYNTSYHLAIVCQFTVADMFCDVKRQNRCLGTKRIWTCISYRSVVQRHVLYCPCMMYFCTQRQTVKYTVHK